MLQAASGQARLLVLGEPASVIAGLEAEADFRREMQLRGLYRRAEHLVLAVQRLGHRTWYAVCKIS